MGWGGAYLQGRQVRAAETEAEARRAMAERDFAMREASARRQSDVDRRRLDLERWQAGRAESEFRIKNDPFLSALPDLIKGFPEGADPALLDAAHDYYVDLIGQGRVTPSDPNGPEWMNAGGNLRPTSPGAQVPAATRPVGPGADQYPARASSGAPPMPALPMEMGGEQDAPVAADRRGTLDQAASRRLGLAGGASSALPEAAPTEMVPGYSSRPGEERPGYLEFGATASEPEQALGEQARHNAGRTLEGFGQAARARLAQKLAEAQARRGHSGAGKEQTKDLEIQQKALWDAKDALGRLQAGMVNINGVWTYVSDQRDPAVREQHRAQLAAATAQVDSMQRALYFGWKDATPGRDPKYLLDARGYAAVRLRELGGDTPANRARVADEIKLRYGSAAP